jgi:F-box and leucine-rich repeat protein 2/20
MTIVLKHSTKITNNGIEVLTKGCPALEYIDLEDCCQLTDGALKSIGQYCRRLTYIDVSDTKVTDMGISDLTLGYPHLQSIFLHNCALLTRDSFSAIGSRCIRLKSLGVKGIITDACLTSLTAGCNPPQNHPINDWFILSDCTSHCHGLIAIDLGECKKLTGAGVEALAKCCPYLKTIDLIDCPNVTDNGLIALGQYCHRLTDLAIRNKIVTDRGIIALVQGCHELQVLSFTGSTLCADNTLFEIAQHCRGLKKIAIMDSKCVSIIGVSALARSCARLEIVELRKCALMRNSAWALEREFEPLKIFIYPIPSDYATRPV